MWWYLDTTVQTLHQQLVPIQDDRLHGIIITRMTEPVDYKQEQRKVVKAPLSMHVQICGLAVVPYRLLSNKACRPKRASVRSFILN